MQFYRIAVSALLLWNTSSNSNSTCLDLIIKLVQDLTVPALLLAINIVTSFQLICWGRLRLLQKFLKTFWESADSTLMDGKSREGKKKILCARWSVTNGFRFEDSSPSSRISDRISCYFHAADKQIVWFCQGGRAVPALSKSSKLLLAIDLSQHFYSCTIPKLSLCLMNRALFRWSPDMKKAMFS